MPTKNVQVNIETHTFLLYLKKQSGMSIKRIIAESLFLFAQNFNKYKSKENTTIPKENNGNDI